jgi:hypothetical protein
MIWPENAPTLFVSALLVTSARAWQSERIKLIRSAGYRIERNVRRRLSGYNIPTYTPTDAGEATDAVSASTQTQAVAPTVGPPIQLPISRHLTTGHGDGDGRALTGAQIIRHNSAGTAPTGSDGVMHSAAKSDITVANLRDAQMDGPAPAVNGGSSSNAPEVRRSARSRTQSDAGSSPIAACATARQINLSLEWFTGLHDNFSCWP